jgi:hypothetical protein
MLNEDLYDQCRVCTVPENVLDKIYVFYRKLVSFDPETNVVIILKGFCHIDTELAFLTPHTYALLVYAEK